MKVAGIGYPTSDVTGSHPGRFHLFHASGSMCSEKCRIVMIEEGLAYTSYIVDITGDPYDTNYHPDYVALRLLAVDLTTTKLVGEGDYEWNGSSSTAATGFDPCVVPTLVDLQAEGGPKVVVDSMVICNYLIAVNKKLIPAGEEALSLMQKHVGLVDDTPHVALLYDGPGEELDTREPFLRRFIGNNNLHNRQLDALDRCLKRDGLTEEVIRAYKAKKAKTEAGKAKSNEIAKNGKGGDYTSNMLVKIQQIFAELESDLVNSKGPWICGDVFTEADAFWAISFYRLINFGMFFMWEGKDILRTITSSMEGWPRRPKTMEYVARLMKRDSVWKASIDYEGNMPSPGRAGLVQERHGYFAAWQIRRQVDMANMMSYVTA